MTRAGAGHSINTGPTSDNIAGRITALTAIQASRVSNRTGVAAFVFIQNTIAAAGLGAVLAAGGARSVAVILLSFVTLLIAIFIAVAALDLMADISSFVIHRAGPAIHDLAGRITSTGAVQRILIIQRSRVAGFSRINDTIAAASFPAVRTASSTCFIRIAVFAAVTFLAAVDKSVAADDLVAGIHPLGISSAGPARDNRTAPGTS